MRSRGRPGQDQGRAGPRRAGGNRRADELPPEVVERLRLARGMAKDGEHDAAAAIFGRMAAAAHGRNRHGMATWLGIQAARSLAHSGDIDSAVAAARQAVTYAVPMKQRTRAGRKFARLVRGLEAAGHASAAQALEAEVRERLGVAKLPDPEGQAVPVNRSMRRGLPKACRACGTRIDPAAVRFEEDGSADCDVCGEVITG